MEKIIIENKLYLVDENDWVTLKINVPRLNIQNMLNATNARLINRKIIDVGYRHHAGIVFECEIKVIFAKIKPYLIEGTLWDAENRKEYIQILYNKRNWGYFQLRCWKSKTGLYAFGDCSRLINNYNIYTPYFYKSGKRILKQNTENNNFGNKRYIRHNHRWLSNKQY